MRCKVSYNPRRKNSEIKFRVEPKLQKEFDEYCDRISITKSDLLREHISFLLEHPELTEYGTGRELLEKMLEAFKESLPAASSDPKDER
jgi:hypothetical protein